MLTGVRFQCGHFYGRQALNAHVEDRPTPNCSLLRHRTRHLSNAITVQLNFNAALVPLLQKIGSASHIV